MNDFLKKGFNLLLRRQTNILSAAVVLMATVILSQILGLFRTRLLFSIFGASNTLGLYNYASILPDTIFQLTIAAILSSAFIPVFSEYLSSGREKEGHKMAATLLSSGLIIFGLFSLLLAIFARPVLTIFNLGSKFSPTDMQTMANLMRIVLIGQLLYIVGTFFTSLLQSYDHFFIPGIAAACYNVGIIIGVIVFSPMVGIYAAPWGTVLGAFIYIIVQIPLAKRVGFSFRPFWKYVLSDGTKKILRLMWPRTLQAGVQQSGTIAVAAIIAFMVDPGRMNLLFDSAKTLMFAPVSLIGYSMAQATFPVLSRERGSLRDFKITFMTSFNQLLYLILPVSALILVLRIPIVRLAYGAERFDWPATVLTGRTLAYLSFSIFAQALIVLYYRAFYALQNSFIPLMTSIASTVVLIIISFILVVFRHMGLESVAIAFSVSNIFQLIILFYYLDRKTEGFNKLPIIISLFKFFLATIVTAFALYIPIKLLDRLVFDTTHTIDLIVLTGISSILGCCIYLFLTWLLDIEEAKTFLLLFKRLGNWREILTKSDESIEPHMKP